MRIKIICVGKLKEKYFIEAERDYLSIISRKIPIEIIELPEDSLSADPLSGEAELIVKHIGKEDFVVCAAVEGKNIGTDGLAAVIAQKISCTVTFIIGGPHGISDNIKKRAGLLISFSGFTFTHRLARLILLDTLMIISENLK